MAGQERAPVILENVSFAQGQHVILREISLQVEAGEFLGLAGPNGAGKTTLIRLILGLIVPAAGRILVLGEEPRHLEKKRRLIGYLPQRPLVDRYFPASVLDVVKMGRTACRGIGRHWRQEDETAVWHTLERLHLEDLATRPVGELSGGQQQLVFLGRALVNKPSLLLVDEPTTGLDRQARERFYSLMHELQEEEDSLTIITVSHDLAGLIRYASRLVYLNGTLKEARVAAAEMGLWPGDAGSVPLALVSAVRPGKEVNLSS